MVGTGASGFCSGSWNRIPMVQWINVGKQYMIKVEQSQDLRPKPQGKMVNPNDYVRGSHSAVYLLLTQIYVSFDKVGSMAPLVVCLLLYGHESSKHVCIGPIHISSLNVHRGLYRLNIPWYWFTNWIFG